MAFVQHDDLVLVRAVVDHVPQREQRVAAGQHRLAPGGVALVADDQAAAVVGDGLVQDGCLLRLLQAGEVVLEVERDVENAKRDKWECKGGSQQLSFFFPRSLPDAV